MSGAGALWGPLDGTTVVVNHFVTARFRRRTHRQVGDFKCVARPTDFEAMAGAEKRVGAIPTEHHRGAVHPASTMKKETRALGPPLTAGRREVRRHENGR